MTLTALTRALNAKSRAGSPERYRHCCADKLAAGFDEGKHPRADDGKFGSGGVSDTGETPGKTGGKDSFPQENTPEFKAWFGDSKVTDESGDPLVVYHGTDEDIQEFPKEKRPSMRAYSAAMGHFFTDKSYATGSYAQGEGANVIPVYLSLKNPKEYDSILDMGDLIGSRQDAIRLREKLIAEGHDGVIARRDAFSEYVAFEPNQIKSATGNSGAFDSDDPSINYAKKSPRTLSERFSRSFTRRIDRYRQSIDSSGTSLNQLAAIFQKVKKSAGWNKGTVNLDLGGGKYDQATLFLRRYGVTNIIIDPYNRPPEANQQAAAKLKQTPADTVTLANVLNVIAEPEEQLKVLKQAKALSKPGAVIYINVHEGDGSGRGQATSKGYQQNRKLADYLPLVQKVFPAAETANGMIVASGVPSKHYKKCCCDKMAAGFDEGKHPRADDGKFGQGGGEKSLSDMDVNERHDHFTQRVHDDDTLPNEFALAFTAAALHAGIGADFDFAELSDAVHEKIKAEPDKDPIMQGITTGNDWNDAFRKSASEEQLTRAGNAEIVFLTSSSRPTALQYVVHPSTYPGVKWQLSAIDTYGHPFGHDVFGSRDDAIKAVTGHPDVSAYDQIGSADYKVNWTSEDGTAAPYAKRGRVAKYKNQWITIGGQKSGDEEHAGGTAVEITETGEITKGPDAIEGADVGDLGEPDWFMSSQKQGPEWENATEDELRDAIARGERVPARVSAKFPGLAAERRDKGLGAMNESKNKVKRDRRTKRMNEARARRGLPPANEVNEGDTETTDAESVGSPPTEPAGEVVAPPSAPAWFRGAPAKQDLRGHGARGHGTSQPELPAPETNPEEKFQRVVSNPQGRFVGAANMKKEDLHVDPHRFQYKVSNIDSKTGITKSHQDTSRFRADWASGMLVWNDPADNKAYVINGHHRHEIATRLGYEGDMSVYFIDAADEKEARSIGALANMSENHGTAIDAAKFMRDNGKTADDLRDEGISLKGKIADEGTILAGLNDAIFGKVATGQMSVNRALAIGSVLTDHGDQSKLMDFINKQEAKGGRKISDAIVGEMARELHQTPRQSSETQSTLFGETGGDSESLFMERNLLKSAIRSKLTDASRAFNAVSSGSRREILEEGGKNVIDADANKQAADDSRLDLHDYDREVNLSGPLSSAVNDASKELANDPKSKSNITNRLLQRVQRILTGEGDDFNAGAMASDSRESQGNAGTWPTEDDERRLTPAAGQAAMFSKRLAYSLNRAFVERYRRN